MNYLEAIDRVIYLLDRDLAPGQKVRAFMKARAALVELGSESVSVRVQAGTLTDVPLIGKSTAAVVSAAVKGEPITYLADLEASTTIEIGQGAELRTLLKGDCHSHSTWSDGGAAVIAMAKAAEAIGHEYLVVTDHSARLTIAHGLGPERLAEQLAEIAQLNEDLAGSGSKFRILTGMEVDILADGALDLADELLSQLDVVVGSVHSQMKQDSATMTRRMVRAIANPNVDILGHCTGRKVAGGALRPPSKFDADYVFAACAQTNTAVEINCRPERQDPPDELLELALEWDCKISIDSDAHAPGQLEWVDYGCDKAARHGIDADRIINTLSADELVRSL